MSEQQQEQECSHGQLYVEFVMRVPIAHNSAVEIDRINNKYNNDESKIVSGFTVVEDSN